MSKQEFRLIVGGSTVKRWSIHRAFSKLQTRRLFDYVIQPDTRARSFETSYLVGNTRALLPERRKKQNQIPVRRGYGTRKVWFHRFFFHSYVKRRPTFWRGSPDMVVMMALLLLHLPSDARCLTANSQK